MGSLTISLLFLATLLTTALADEKDLSCPKTWHLSGKSCYKLDPAKAESEKDASKACRKLIGSGSRLPITVEEADWKEVVDFASSKDFDSSVNAFWLGLSYNADNDKWLWRNTIPPKYTNWKSPPGSVGITTVPDGDKGNATGVGWVKGSENGWAKAKREGSYSALCKKRAYRKILKVNSANKKLTLESVGKAISNVKLPAGTPVALAIKFEELKQILQKLIEMGKFVANLVGKGPEFQGPKAPLRGDMLVTLDELKKEFNTIKGLSGFGKKKRDTVKETGWGAQRTITYNYDKDFLPQKEAKKAFDDALRIWQDGTCFNFTISNTPDVIVLNGGGCYSTVGKGKFKPPQPLSIGEGCESIGIASHEIGHMLGLVHQQARADRENFVRVYLPNVDINYIDNFRTCCDCVDKSPYGYDFGSVMHYSPNEFSKNGGPTVLPSEHGFQQVVGNALGPSFLDIKQVNAASCKDACKGPAAVCKNGGYPSPRNCQTCLCPIGYGGKDCADYAPYGASKCGESKPATEDYVEYSTPNYPNSPPPGYCVWMFKAKPGQFVEVEFYRKVFDLPEDCYNGYVEVKDSADPSVTGKRYCTSRHPKKFTSESNTIIVITYITEAEKDVYGVKWRVRSIATKPTASPGDDAKEKAAAALASKTASLITAGSPPKCATIAGWEQNAGPAGLTLRADNE